MLLLSFIELNAQTYISDNQEVYGNWTKSNSPYIIEGKAIVPYNKELKIDKGVIIKLQTKNISGTDYTVSGRGYFHIKGTLIAEGTQDEPILVTNTNKGKQGGFILFDNSISNNLLDYCIIEGGYPVILEETLDGTVEFINSSGKVSNCIFKNNYHGITCLNKSNISISNCFFYNNSDIAIIAKYSSPNITNTTFYNNGRAGIYTSGDANPVIINSIIWDKIENYASVTSS